MAGRRILIVEDEYLIAVELADHFKSVGATTVGPVANLKCALEIVKGDGWLDGAVLDIDLDGDEVYSVAEALRERQVPFVFATGYDRGSISMAFADVPCCEKPVDPEVIARTLLGCR